MLICSAEAFLISKPLLTNLLFDLLPTKIYAILKTINEINATLKLIINKVRTIKEVIIIPVIS